MSLVVKFQKLGWGYLLKYFLYLLLLYLNDKKLGEGTSIDWLLPTYCKQPESSQSQEPETQSDSPRRMERTQYWGHHCLEVYSGIRKGRTQTGTLIPDADTLSSILTTVPNTYAWLPLELMNPYLPHGELGINFWNESLVFCVTAFHISLWDVYCVASRACCIISCSFKRSQELTFGFQRNQDMSGQKTDFAFTCVGRCVATNALSFIYSDAFCNSSVPGKCKTRGPKGRTLNISKGT